MKIVDVDPDTSIVQQQKPCNVRTEAQWKTVVMAAQKNRLSIPFQITTTNPGLPTLPIIDDLMNS